MVEVDAMRCDIRTTSLCFRKKNTPLFMRAAAACYCKEEPLKLRRRATAPAGSTAESSAASEGMLARECSLFLRMWLQQKVTRIRRAAGRQKTKQNKKTKQLCEQASERARTHTIAHLSSE